MAEIRHLGCWRQNAKTCFPGKLSNLVSCNWAFQRTHYWIPKISDGWDPPSWKWTWRLFFCQDGPIWIKCWRLLQNDMSTATMCSKSKPGVEFQYGGNLGEFNGNHITSHGENGTGLKGLCIREIMTDYTLYYTKYYTIILRFPMPWRSAL